MKNKIHILLLVASLLTAAVLPLRAQVVADGATNTLNNVTNNIVGDVIVGTNGAFTLLILTNNALLTNSGGGYIGDTVTANSNAVWLTGASTRWSMGYSLLVGVLGNGNRLVITNGARVENTSGRLGFTQYSSNNQAVVTGAGSFWSNRFELAVGEYGSGNRLVITNGGAVFSSNSVIVGVASGAVSNFVLLSTGALLTNTYDGVLGANTNANFNTAFVSDLNSRWLMGGNFHVGSNGAFNRLVITNGALVGDDYGYLGSTTSSSNNEALVTGTGSVWSNRLGLYVGVSGGGNRLVITNGSVARSQQGLLGLNPDSSNNVVLVTGAGSLWTNQSDLFVGFGGAGNQLVVSSGGILQNTNGYLGYGSSSGNNLVLVTGAGSRWTNQADLSVGYNGPGNQLVVSNGGVVRAFAGIIGLNSTSSNNVAIVTGAGSLWTNDSLHVGYWGSGTLVVSNGGVVRDFIGYMSRDPISANNVAVVTGTGSLWANQWDLSVGERGAGNQLVVSDGGVLRNRSGYLGDFYSSTSNVAVITGAGSLWTNELDFAVGYSGGGNQLVVSNGGVVRATDGYLGINSTSSDNAVVVTGAGSLWRNESDLFVGYYGSGNQLVVSNTAVLRNANGTIGSFSSSNNAVVVTGAGSLWTNSGNLLVGSNGAFNQLIVSAGGAVRATGRVTLGVGPTATNNSVLAVGGSLASVGLRLGNSVSRNNSVTLLSGSIWDVGGGTFIWGNAGFDDTLTIDATSALTNIGGLTLDQNHTTFHLTNAPGGFTLNGFTTNQFQFSPSGAGAMIVGNDGPNVQLIISNFTLANATGIIGNNVTAQSNLVVIAGAGSVWSNSSTLNIGNFGSFNQLVVSNGGALRAGGLVTLGNADGSTNNSVLAVGGLLSSVGLTLGNVASRNNSVTLLSSSIWELGGGTFTWGNAGISDTLTIDGSSAMTNIGALTLDENNTINLLTVTSLNGLNVGFKTSGLGALVVGNAGTNVQLAISNFIWAGTSGDIGLGAASRSNSVFLSGVGSTWSNSGALKIGNSGAFNQLVISNGAQARDSDGYLGFSSSSSNNEALVTGAGSFWSSRSNLVVGNFGSGNRLTVSNAATISASNSVVLGFNGSALNNSLLLSTGALLTNGGNGVLGFSTGANSNAASVSGTNSRWQMSGNLYVGSNSAFNQLVISNTGTVSAGNGVVVGSSASNNLLLLSTGALLTNGGNGVLGFDPAANSNTASLSGANTRWQMSGNLSAGNSGAFSRLVISNGALAENNYGYIGFNSSSSSNEVVVTATNSWWNNRFDLHVGYSGNGNRLVISNSALVGNTDGYVGRNSSGNEVLVTGAGSYWSNRYFLNVGYSGGANRLVISDGGLVDDTFGAIGPLLSGSSNVVLVTGANSCWSNRLDLYVGSGIGNWLVISNGGRVDNRFATIGHNYFNGNNGALITDANSYWNNRSDLSVGYAGFENWLVVSNGAGVWDESGFVGHYGSAENNQANRNEAVVTGAGSFWNHRSELHVGYEGFGNRLMIANGGSVFAVNGVYVGFSFLSSSNLLTVSGGSLIVTNQSASGVLDIRRGTNVFHSGTMDADRLRLTNSLGFFAFNGGTLKTKGTTNINGRVFAVGNGASLATFELAGNGLHTFSSGLAISNNASLRGNGTISGALTVVVGGTLSPGTSIGKIVLNNPPALLGNVIMEISRNGAVLTNDQVQVAGTLPYGGSLTVSNLGPDAFTAGDNFQLFNASGYSGVFTSITLPPLNAGLTWTNKLSVDGSIQVVGSLSPQFGSIVLSGTNLVISGTGGPANGTYFVLASTNVALALTNWTPILTNQFDASGNFSLTNAISFGVAQRFFTLQAP